MGLLRRKKKTEPSDVTPKESLQKPEPNDTEDSSKFTSLPNLLFDPKKFQYLEVCIVQHVVQLPTIKYFMILETARRSVKSVDIPKTGRCAVSGVYLKVYMPIRLLS